MIGRTTKAALAVSLAAASTLAIALGLPQEVEPRADRPADRAAAAPRCRFAPGETAAFTIESTVREVRGDEADHLQATLSWEVAEALTPTRWRLRAALSGVTQRSELTSPEDRAEGPITDPFFVDVDASCRFVGFGFAREWDARRRQLVQSTLMTHEFVVPSAGRRARWSASQSDGLGPFEASYELASAKGSAAAKIKRRKLAYDGDARVAAVGLAVAVVGSEATATFDPEHRWLIASTALDRVQILVQGEVQADLLQRSRLVRDDARYLAVPAADPGDADFHDAFDLEIERALVVDAEVVQRSHDEALAAFLGRFGGADDPSYAAARELAAWLKAHPEGAQQLAAALRAGEIDDVARPALFLGLELSGSEEAREVLSDLLVDARLRPVDRARAASALADLGEPTRGTAELLLTRAQEDGDAMVANVSLLGLGTMSRRSGDDEVQSYVREALREELAAAGDEGRARVLLDAMGNSGDPALADVVAAHLDAESPATRGHAAEALGRLDPAESGPRLLARLGAESDPSVRTAIVGAYHGPPTADAIARMSETLAASTSTSERSAIITWLGNAARSEPEAQGLLVAHLQRETNARLMQQIGAFVPAEALR